MTEGRFYKAALLTPLVLPLAAGVVVALTKFPGLGQLREYTLMYVLFAFAYTAVWSTVPYLLFVGPWLWLMHRRRFRVPTVRRVMWVTPFLIAFPFALVLSIPDFAEREWESGFAQGIFSAFWAILIGYVYVLLIEIARVLTIALGILERGVE